MPRTHRILNLPGFSIKKIEDYQPVLLHVQYNRKPRCPHCDSYKVRKKDSFMRQVRHEPYGHRQSILRFKAYKLYCNHCKRYGNQQFPGIGKHQRSSERLQTYIYHQHSDGISQSRLAEVFRLGKATIERWYNKRFKIENNEFSDAVCPRILGIDEHFFSRKQGFATTLCDLRKHKIYDIVKGKSEADLNQFLQQLPGKERVKVICMDLSTTYRSIARKHFPQAKIVADRFHVIRLMQHQCMKTYRQLTDKIKYNRGLLALLRTKPERLSHKKLLALNRFLDEHPAIRVIYQFQQQLYEILMKKTCTQQKCKQLIPHFLGMVKALKDSPFKALRSLGKTFYLWREEIVRMWRFSKSNGITEGFHRKMKLIQRRAYGFKNFENYRTRVRVLCC